VRGSPCSSCATTRGCSKEARDLGCVSILSSRPSVSKRLQVTHTHRPIECAWLPLCDPLLTPECLYEIAGHTYQVHTHRPIECAWFSLCDPLPTPECLYEIAGHTHTQTQTNRVCVVLLVPHTHRDQSSVRVSPCGRCATTRGCSRAVSPPHA